MIELLFLLGFSLHNIEEALWLPAWSKNAKKFHKEVSEKGFRFAVIAVTVLGYLITFQYFIFSPLSFLSKVIYSGFVLMMVLNAVFPHLLATIILRSYAPGTMTALLLNVPIGLYILYTKTNGFSEMLYTIFSGLVLSLLVILMINPLFAIGEKITD